MNLSDILYLKFPSVDFQRQVIIQDDGNGLYIAKWDAALGPKPNQAQLDQWALELAPVKATLDARAARRQEYPPIGDQLDMLYKAMDAGILPKVPDFYDSIKAVKDKYPVQS